MENTEVIEPVLPAPVVTDDTKPVIDTPEVTAAEGEVDKQEQEVPKPKVFTQEELDAKVQKRLYKERMRWEREQRESVPQQPHSEPREGDEQPTKPRITDADVEAYLANKRSAQAVESFIEKAEDASDKYPDFMRVVSDPRLPFDERFLEFFAESDVGVELAYMLAKDPAKAHSIAGLSAVKAGRELTRLETEIKAKPKANPSNAPEPIKPVGTRGKPASSALPSDDDDISTWMKKEQARIRSR